MPNRMSIEWEHYLADESDPSINPLAATDDQLDALSSRFNVKLPKSFREMLASNAGMTPMNLRPRFASGEAVELDCINHADLTPEDKDDLPYLIDFSTSALKDEGYTGLLCFSVKGNTFYCLDYGVRKMDPPVVVINRDCPPDDPEHKYNLADNFDEFLAKYTVPPDQAPA